MSNFKLLDKVFQLLKNRYIKEEWLTVWYDPDRDRIVDDLPEDGIYDLYILYKNGNIKRIKKKDKLEILACRFRHYKKYLVIIQLNIYEEVVESEGPEAV